MVLAPLMRVFPPIAISAKEKQCLSEVNKRIDALFAQGMAAEAETLKENSVKRLTFLLGPWICNFRCPEYCYTKGTDLGALSASQAIRIIEQARQMGIRSTYWAGEGELALLKTFWEIMDYQAARELPAVVFTNGSVFHDDSLCQKTLGIASDELVSRLNKDYPNVYFYVKFWSNDQTKAARMVGVPAREYPYATFQGRTVPLALAKLLNGISRERVGAEVMVSSENYDDVVANVLPAIEALDMFAFVEPVIFSGNATNRQAKFSLNDRQYRSLAGVFASGGKYCEKRQSAELIVRGTCLTPGIAIPPRAQDSVIADNGEVKDVFSIFHNEYFRRMRELSESMNGCLCRAFWNGTL